MFTADPITRFHSARKGSERNSWSQERLVLAFVIVLGIVYHFALAVVLEVGQVLYLPAVLCLKVIETSSQEILFCSTIGSYRFSGSASHCSGKVLVSYIALLLLLFWK